MPVERFPADVVAKAACESPRTTTRAGKQPREAAGIPLVETLRVGIGLGHTMRRQGFDTLPSTHAMHAEVPELPAWSRQLCPHAAPV